MPDMTTQQLAVVLQTKFKAQLDKAKKDPEWAVQLISDVVTNRKNLPAGITLEQLVDAAHDVFSREVGAKRSPKWDATRKKHLKLYPECEFCGNKANLSVHHILPFHLRPDLELEESNLITLCEKSDKYGWSCHYLLGHSLDWHGFVPTVRKVIQYAKESAK